MKKGGLHILTEKVENILPSVSLDCVILGFHEGTIKILLNRFKINNSWMLPGGFVFIDEDVDAAAYRLLSERTHLSNIYLTQFHTFGDYGRTSKDENRKMLERYNIKDTEGHWLLDRYIGIGYYALVDFFRVNVQTTEDEESQWFDLQNIPPLYADHNRILDKAISSIRMQLGYIPISYELLPEKFTMSELRVIYEAILGKPVDRRNFQRRMITSGIVVPLAETSKKWGVKAAALFTFDKEKYKEAMENGLLSL